MNSLIKCVSATALTIALFLLMGYLITPSGAAPTEVTESPTIDISRQQRDETSEKKRQPPPPPPAPEQTPPPPQLVAVNLRGGGADIVFDEPKIDLPSGPALLLPGDRRATPTLRIPPQYPRSENTRGEEGWVLVEFTIAADGRVTDVVVIEAEGGRGGFEREAIRAVKRWKYEPKMANGKAIAQYNMREIFRFQITE